MMGHAEMVGEKNPHPGAAEMSEEQRADLHALKQGMGDDPGRSEDIQPESSSLKDEIKGAILLLVAMSGPALPCLARIYSAEVVEQVSTVVSALCNKHGWLQGGLAGGHGEEVAAAIVLLPLGYSTYIGIKGDIAARNPVTVTGPLQVLGGEVPSGAASTGQGVTFGNVAENSGGASA